MNNKVYLRLASLYKIEYDYEIKDNIFYFKSIFKDIKSDFIYYIPEYITYYEDFEEYLISEGVEKFYNEIKKLQAREFIKTLNRKEQKLILRHLQ
jgi:hypothetical protein